MAKMMNTLHDLLLATLHLIFKPIIAFLEWLDPCTNIPED